MLSGRPAVEFQVRPSPAVRPVSHAHKAGSGPENVMRSPTPPSEAVTPLSKRLGAEARERGLLLLAGRAERLAVAASGR